MEMHKAKAVAACNEPMIFFLCLNITSPERSSFVIFF